VGIAVSICNDGAREDVAEGFEVLLKYFDGEEV